MSRITRRRFIQGMGGGALLSLVWKSGRNGALHAQAGPPFDLYVARNGTFAANVEKVLDMAGGISRFVGTDDVVVIKPNGQWPRQGYTHTGSMKALIDAILARSGGFSGEVIIAEHIHRSPAAAMGGNYCWNISAGYNRTNNWPDMSYFELIAHYAAIGRPNVTAVPLYDVSADPANWAVAGGPAEVPAGKHAWVRLPLYTAANGRTITPSYPILRSPYSGRLIDLHRGGGVWEGGAKTGRAVRLIILPTLNNHGSGGEDYAGITSAVKCHIGFQEGISLHNVGYGSSRPDCVGESVGHLITQVFAPSFYLTCAEYSGHYSRTGAATQTRAVGLCADPVTLDYWMSKHVLYPCNSAPYFHPDNDNNTRRTLLGCRGKGVGTLNENEIRLHLAVAASRALALGAGWNWISFNVLPVDRSMNAVFGGILGQVEQVKGQTCSAVRSGGAWKGDLPNMDGIQAGHMYKVKVGAACTLNVDGYRIAANTPIPLNAGWNWAAFYPEAAMPVAQALASIQGQALEVKSRTQSATFDGTTWSGAMTQMEPGRGYAVRMASAGILIYPEG